MGALVTKSCIPQKDDNKPVEKPDIVVAGVAISSSNPKSIEEEGAEKYLWLHVSKYDTVKMLKLQQDGYVPVGIPESIYVTMRAPRPDITQHRFAKAKRVYSHIMMDELVTIELGETSMHGLNIRRDVLSVNPNIMSFSSLSCRVDVNGEETYYANGTTHTIFYKSESFH